MALSNLTGRVDDWGVQLAHWTTLSVPHVGEVLCITSQLFGSSGGGRESPHGIGWLGRLLRCSDSSPHRTDQRRSRCHGGQWVVGRQGAARRSIDVHRELSSQVDGVGGVRESLLPLIGGQARKQQTSRGNTHVTRWPSTSAVCWQDLPSSSICIYTANPPPLHARIHPGRPSFTHHRSYLTAASSWLHCIRLISLVRIPSRAVAPDLHASSHSLHNVKITSRSVHRR